MTQQVRVTWINSEGQHSAVLFAEGAKIVGMSEVTTVPRASSRVVVAQPGEEKKYLGDHVANGCQKRKELLNRADRAVRRFLR